MKQKRQSNEAGEERIEFKGEGYCKRGEGYYKRTEK